MPSTYSDWQLDFMQVKQRVEHLLQSGQRSDCTFLVGTEPTQAMVRGHKLVLAMASPVFDAMLYGAMAEKNLIRILDMQPDTFKALLEYIYTDNVNISSFDKALELYYGAKKYMLPHLVKECTMYLWYALSPKNACRTYEFAKLFEEKALMDRCLKVISESTEEVLTDSSFVEVELSTVITVFSLDDLNVNSELDLFEAAEKYAKAQDKRCLERSATSPTAGIGAPTENEGFKFHPGTINKKDVTVDDSVENSPLSVTEPCKTPEPEQITPGPSGDDGKKNIDTKDKPTTTVRSAIDKIRFLTLTGQQFAAGPARSPLLSMLEAFAVTMNILSNQPHVPMPQGFSTCRKPRKNPVDVRYNYGYSHAHKPQNVKPRNTNIKAGDMVLWANTESRHRWQLGIVLSISATRMAQVKINKEVVNVSVQYLDRLE